MAQMIDLEKVRQIPRKTGEARRPTLSKAVRDGLSLMASKVEICEGNAEEYLGFSISNDKEGKEWAARFANAIIAADWVRRTELWKSRNKA